MSASHALTGSPPAACLREVGHRFGRHTALDGVTTAFADGAVTGLLGRNGAGKTTLMRLLTGHVRPSSGRVEVAGRDPFECADVLRSTCFVHEGQRYPSTIRVGQVLEAASLLQPRWDAAFARELAADFALRSDQRVVKLSRGQLSAVGIVLGLASRAPLTLFDEPYLGLDATARQLFYDRLLADYAAFPRTVLLSTHLVDEVADLLEHVVVLDRGRVVLDASADDVRGRGAVLTGPHEAVAALVAGRSAAEEQRLGGEVRVRVDWPLTPRQRDAARERGVRVTPLTLQQLVVGAGARPAHADLEEASR